MQLVSTNILKSRTSQAIGASQTDLVISEVLKIDVGTRIRVDIAASSVTSAVGLTVKLQDSMDKLTWSTLSSAGQVAVTVDATVTINLLDTVSGDQVDLPLRPFIRVIITTGAGDAATIDAIFVAHDKA